VSNWFETNQTKSVILYTLLVIAGTWAAFTFIFDENRINLSRAQVEEAKAMAEQYKAKSEVLQTENARLAVQNSTYLRWLEGQSGTFPSLELQVAKLSEEKNTLAEALSNTKPTASAEPTRPAEPTSTAEPPKIYARESGPLKLGQTFVDPETGAIIGVSEMTPSNQAKVTVSLPGKATETADRVTPGKIWNFDYQGRKFVLTLTNTTWLNDTFQASVRELGQ
jgi:hypothetical protein